MSIPGESSHDIPKDVRNWAMACHLTALIGVLGNGIGYFLGPLVTWLIKKDDHPFIDEHGKESVNFQLTMLIALVACAPLILIIVGIPLMILIAILMTVMPIIGGIKAANGERFEYPMSIRFLK